MKTIPISQKGFTFTFHSIFIQSLIFKKLSAAHHNAPPVYLPLPPALCSLPPPLLISRLERNEESTNGPTTKPSQRPTAGVKQPTENFLHRRCPLIGDYRTCIHNGGSGQHHQHCHHHPHHHPDPHPHRRA